MMGGPLVPAYEWVWVRRKNWHFLRVLPDDPPQLLFIYLMQQTVFISRQYTKPVEDSSISGVKNELWASTGTLTAHPKNTLILTHGDVDGMCAAAIAKVSYPKAEVEFATPADFLSKLDSLSGHDRVIILDLGVGSAQKNEAMKAFQKLSKTSSIIYIDHHLRPPGVTERSLACSGTYRTGASTSELAWEFFKPDASHDFIAVLGAVGDYAEKTPPMQGLIERYGERRVYPEALFLEWALMVADDSFKRGVIEELAQGKWPYQMSIMGEEADSIVRRQRTLEKYVREKAEKICEHVLLIRNPPFKATGSAATLLTKRDDVDVGIASRREGDSVYLSLRRHEESDINLASLISESALKSGGAGGGHKAAAGGKIPVERFDELLQEIRRRLPEGRLKRIKGLGVKFTDKKMVERKLFKEIIEHKRAEMELEKSEERYRTLVETLPDVIYSLSEDGKITSLNPAFEKITGWSRAKWLGKPFTPLVHPDDLPLAMEAFQKTLRGETPPLHELRILSKSGEYLTGEFTGTPQIKGGKVVGEFGIVRDITERKRAEEALRESEEHYRSLIETSPDAVTKTDLEGHITFVSPRTLELHGYKSAEELIGRSAFDLIAPEDHERAMMNLQKTMKEGVVRKVEYTFLKKDGTRFIGELSAALIKDAYGKPKAFIATTRDITERKRAKDKLRIL